MAELSMWVAPKGGGGGGVNLLCKCQTACFALAINSLVDWIIKMLKKQDILTFNFAFNDQEPQ